MVSTYVDCYLLLVLFVLFVPFRRWGKVLYEGYQSVPCACWSIPREARWVVRNCRVVNQRLIDLKGTETQREKNLTYQNQEAGLSTFVLSCRVTPAVLGLEKRDVRWMHVRWMHAGVSCEDTQHRPCGDIRKLIMYPRRRFEIDIGFHRGLRTARQETQNVRSSDLRSFIEPYARPK